MEVNVSADSLELSGSGEDIAAIEGGRLPPPNSAEGLSEDGSDASGGVVPVTARTPQDARRVSFELPSLDVNAVYDARDVVAAPQAPRKPKDAGFFYEEPAPKVVCKNSGIDAVKLGFVSPYANWR